MSESSDAQVGDGPSAIDGEAAMHLHRPKPLHGVRDLLVEIGVIVVGIVIALAGEQAVEWAHRSEEVNAARTALHAEMSADLRNLVLEEREDHCWLGAIAAYQAWAAGRAPKPVSADAVTQGLNSTVWDVAKTGAVPLMPLQERLRIARFYSGIENQERAIIVQSQYRRTLAGYRDRESLDTEEAHAFIRALGEVRFNVIVEARNLPILFKRARDLGVQPGAPMAEWEAQDDKFCAAYPQPPAEELR